MISTRSKSKSVLVVPKTRRKKEHCETKKQLILVNKNSDTNNRSENQLSWPLSSFITSNTTIVAPDCIDAQTRRSKRHLHLPAKLTFDLGSFGMKQVKLKQSDESLPSCKKYKKNTRDSHGKDLQTSTVVLKTISTTKTPVSSIVLNKSDIELDTDAESTKFVCKHRELVDDVTPVKLDDNESNDAIECTSKQNSIEIQSETFSVQPLSTNSCNDDISEQNILLADSNISDLHDRVILLERNPEHLPASEHDPVQNDSSQLQIQQHSSSVQTESSKSLLCLPKIVNNCSDSCKSQPDVAKVFLQVLPEKSKFERSDVREKKKLGVCFDINELEIDMLFPAQYKLDDVKAEKEQDKIFGAVSAIVKPMDLDKNDFKRLLMGVAKRTGVTPVFSSNADTLIHGSWQAVNRAYQLLQDVGKLMLQEESSAETGEEKQCPDIVQDNGDSYSDTGEIQEDIQTTDIDSTVSPHNTNISVSTDPSAPTYGCSVCAMVFTDADRLWVHSKSHKHESEWKCQICGKSFNVKRYLQVHIKRHNREREYKCPMCEWSFFEKHKLKLHMEKHKTADQKNLPYKCENCDRKFYNRAARSDHMNTHTGERPYRCHVCQSTFSHRVGLTRHMLVHSDEKLYKCGNCEKSFKFKDKLTAHMVQHTGVGGHRCSTCQKVFTASSSLKRHKCTAMEEVIIDTEETIFMCGICGEVVDTLENAQLHVTTHDDQNVAQEFVNIENEGSYLNNSNMLEGIQNFPVAEVLHLESTETVGDQMIKIECIGSERTSNNAEAIAEKHLVANTLADLSALA